MEAKFETMNNEVLLEKLTYRDVEQVRKDKTIIILPMGPLEAHGPHLPLGTDFFGAKKLCELTAPKLLERGLSVLAAPVLPYTLADVAMPFPGTVTLRRDTVVALVCDIFRSFCRHGFKHFVLLCHHLERPNLAALHEAAARVSAEEKASVLVSNAILDCASSSAKLLKGEHPEWDFHAGESETAFCLWSYPDLVKKDVLSTLAPNWSDIRQRFAQGARDFVEAGGPECYFGDPQKATPELGKKLYEGLSSALAEEIVGWFMGEGI